MNTKTLQQSKVGKIENSPIQSPNSRKYAAVRTREYLLVSEIEAMRDALKKAGGCHTHRDSTLILLIYRHGLRVAEAAALRWEQIDWSGGNLHVKRVKTGTPSTQPLYGDEIRALRKLQRDYPASPYIFQSSRRGPLASSPRRISRTDGRKITTSRGNRRNREEDLWGASQFFAKRRKISQDR
ncbi:tyrosine-type recombinase/integrase [Anabaena sp. WFMT]|jgi:integrase|uniref:tyrosine-type recombinase/integrase n=1 Tax=Anabaena sp. WFMT TaxID=3449730 RepID=UPI003F2751EE